MGADSSIVGYNAGGLAIGAQFAFNVPNVVPLPGENLIEDDVPFARPNVGQGPVVDSIGAPYYPGDIAANLGSLLAEFGAPAAQFGPVGLNDTNLAHTQFPNSPSAPSQASFGVSPSTGTPANPSIFYSNSNASASGGDATGIVSDFALDNVGGAPAASSLLPSSSQTGAAQSLVDVGNVSATDKVSLGDSSITSTATSQVNGIQIAGLVDIAGLTSTANATSDGTTGTPTASTSHGSGLRERGVRLHRQHWCAHHLDQHTGRRRHTRPAPADGRHHAEPGRNLHPPPRPQTDEPRCPQASADAGGLAVSIHPISSTSCSFRASRPFRCLELGNTGLPAGLYTVTTSMTFGLAQANVQANVAPAATGNTGNTGAAPAASTSSSSAAGTTGNSGSAGFLESFGNTGNTGTFGTTSVQPTGAGEQRDGQPPTAEPPGTVERHRLPDPGHPGATRMGGASVGVEPHRRLSIPATRQVAIRTRTETMMLDMQNDLAEVSARPEGPLSRQNNGGRRGGGGGGTDAPEAEAPTRDAKRDLRNGWQVLAGSVLIPLGVVLILIAWYGAAHARVVQQQIPYLVSGSFVGLGCMVLGGFFFFGHWLYRMYDQAGLHHEEQMRALERRSQPVRPGGRPGRRALPGCR